jgi:hypothetical protein
MESKLANLMPATEVINADGIVMEPRTLQVKTDPTSDQPIHLVNPAERRCMSMPCPSNVKNQQLAPILNPSNFQVKALASIGQSTHLVNPINTNGIVMTPSTLQVKAAAMSDHGSNQQLNSILKPSSFQAKAPALICQSAHLVNPVNTNGIVMTPSTLQVKAAATSDHGSNQQLNSILKPSSFQAKAPASICQSAQLVNFAECRYEHRPKSLRGHSNC